MVHCHGSVDIAKKCAAALAVAGGIVVKTVAQGANDDRELMVTGPVAIVCDIGS